MGRSVTVLRKLPFDLPEYYTYPVGYKNRHFATPNKSPGMDEKTRDQVGTPSTQRTLKVGSDRTANAIQPSTAPKAIN